MKTITARRISNDVLSALLKKNEDKIAVIEGDDMIIYINSEILNAFPFNALCIKFKNGLSSLALDPYSTTSLNDYVARPNDKMVIITSDEAISAADQMYYDIAFGKLNTMVSFDLPTDASIDKHPVSNAVDKALKEYIRIVEAGIPVGDKDKVVDYLRAKANDLCEMISYKEIINNLPNEVDGSSLLDIYRKKVCDNLNRMVRITKDERLSIETIKSMMQTIQNQMEKEN